MNVFICLLICFPILISGKPTIAIQTLFEKPAAQGEYRIPGILALGDGTVIVTCGDRKGRGDFGHATTNVIRRSIDGGKTWLAEQVIVENAETDIHNGPIVQDRETGKVFKFCRFWPGTKDGMAIVGSWTYEEMAKKGWIDYLQISEDSGESWSEAKMLKLPFAEGVVSAATGNGVHGIQLLDGTLVIQGGYNVMKEGKPTRQCCTLISKDHGTSWEIGRHFDTGKLNIVREFVFAQRTDGSVYHNFRSVLGSRSISIDCGELRADLQLPDIECHAGLTSWKPTGKSPICYFTQPAPVGNDRKQNFSVRRQRLVLRTSQDEGKTWDDGLVIFEKASAYSDIAVLEDGTVLVVFENGDKIGQPYQRVSLARITGL
jgi:sialidase-1